MKLTVEMKMKTLYISMIVALLPVFSAGAQSETNEKFAIKATADIGLGRAMSVDCALDNMSAKSSASDFGIDFGWTFWTQRENSLEANIGLGYGSCSLKTSIPGLDYNYSAPAAADMDNVPYIRYYEVEDLHQKIRTNRLVIPIYLNYGYEINERVVLHALLGVKLGFNLSSKITESGCKVFSYGVYPQYDNLMIDASYMNEFGHSVLDKSSTLTSEANGVTASLLTGVGAEVRIWGPVSAELSFRYECGLNDMYKKMKSAPATFSYDNAPVTYTVVDGQKVAALSKYLTRSKISRLSCGISLIYRF